MKKNILVLAICLLGTLLFAQEKERVAVLPFTGGEGREGDAIAQFLGNALTDLGGFDIVPRTQAINKILEEHEFQRNGLTDGDTIVDLGKGANAKYVVSGHIQNLGSRKMIMASILDVETFQQVSGDYHEYDGDLSEVVAYLPTLAANLVRNTKKNYSNVPTLAILPFDGVDENNADVLAQLLSIELANSGKYVVVTRTTTIKNVMKEHDFQRDGLTDENSISKLGEATNADYVLSGSVLSVGSDNYINVQIIDVLTFVQKDGDHVEYKTIEEGIELISDLSYELTGVRNNRGAEIVIGLIETVLVKAGSFQMGSNDGHDNEAPVHKVTLTKDYYMGIHEVTQKQWYEVMGTNPSYFGSTEGWENLPVERVTWYDAVEFCNALSKKEGLEPYYTINKTKTDANNSSEYDDIKWTVTISAARGAKKGYRLPTEAEWEYAARGGNMGDHNLEYAGSNSIGEVAWYSDNSDDKTQEVGTKQANDLGLYDMSGNVWEWCWDWYASYPSEFSQDPTGATGGTYHVLRGGCWRNTRAFGYCRVAHRLLGSAPTFRYDGVGFRVVRSSLP